MKSKIYTRTGDTGSTQYGNSRISKKSDMIQIIGDLDELNCHIGRLIEEIEDKNSVCLYERPKIIKKLTETQHKLFNFGIDLDNLTTKSIFNEDILKVESWIDEIDEKLPKLKNFILPRGSLEASQCHICRAVCRRTERSFVKWLDNLNNNYFYYEFHLQYLNRLSDFLFVLARYLTNLLGNGEILWNLQDETLYITPN